MYRLSLRNPTSQSVTANFTQSTAFTPTLAVLNTLPLASGSQTVRLNRTTLATVNPASISMFNVLNPTKLYDVPSWSYNAAAIEFTTTLNAGKYGFKVWFVGYGWGNCGEITVTAATAYTAPSVQSSLLGGRITVQGSDISPDAVLKVGGFVGRVIEKRSTEAVFEIPPLIVPDVATQYPSVAQEQTIVPAAILSDGGSNSDAAFDYNHGSFYSSTNSVCFIGLDAGVGKVVKVTRIRYFPYYKWTIAANFIKGAVFEGSLDGTTYTQIATVDQTVHAGWNSIQLSAVAYYRFIRLKHTSTSGCKLSEFEVNGLVFNDLVVADYTDFTTNAQFWDGHNSYDFAGAIRYQSSVTPVVSSITPNKGTIYGGTTLIFDGVNFDVTATPSVLIDGVSCTVTVGSVTTTSFTCVTGARLTFPDKNSLSVTFGNNNALL